jgi:hypothetical protein
MILSGLLYEVNAAKNAKFGMFRQMPYSMMLHSHPAIAQFGVPPDDFKIITTAYGIKDTPGSGEKRPYSIMSRLLTGNIIGPEKLWVSMEDVIISSVKYFPVKENSVFISTGRETKGRTWDIAKWNALVELAEKLTGLPVIQIGAINDERALGAFDLRGKAGVKQSFQLIKEKAAVVISVDSYAHLAAKWAQKPAVVIWGGPDRAAYGYDDQINLENPDDTSDNMSAMSVEQVFEALKKAINK